MNLWEKIFGSKTVSNAVPSFASKEKGTKLSLNEEASIKKFEAEKKKLEVAKKKLEEEQKRGLEKAAKIAKLEKNAEISKLELDRMTAVVEMDKVDVALEQGNKQNISKEEIKTLIDKRDLFCAQIYEAETKLFFGVSENNIVINSFDHQDLLLKNEIYSWISRLPEDARARFGWCMGCQFSRIRMYGHNYDKDPREEFMKIKAYGTKIVWESDDWLAISGECNSCNGHIKVYIKKADWISPLSLKQKLE
jgi:hypothetical protein